MINASLLDPSSIVVVGGSADLSKPGGKVLKNLIDGQYSGGLYVVNPKADEVQGIRSYKNPGDLPGADLAILAIAARFCPDAMHVLAKEKNTLAFIVLSAGFSEENEEGAELEQRLVDIANEYGACLIGPNCIGFLNQKYQGVFTTPLPVLDPSGCDFISGSGATAVFIMESGIPRGLRFSSVYSVGNSAQVGVEDVLRYMDENYDPVRDSSVKLLYLESISRPDLLLRHTASLIRKGCRIAAIKAGYSEAGSRAASSHTGAMASSDTAVDALFRKAGIVRCHSREELVAVASVFMHKQLKGRRLAVISHAGGPAVMMTDSLTTGGFEVPRLSGPVMERLLEKLYPGSSVANPIDFLATGNAQQLDAILETCEHELDNIDGMAVIFGSPGLTSVDEVYEVIHRRMDSSVKPVFPVLPSVINASREIEEFKKKGRVYFQDEVVFSRALVSVCNAPQPADEVSLHPEVDHYAIRQIIGRATGGYLGPGETGEMLDATGIPRPAEETVRSLEEAVQASGKLGFPLVMKVVGPLHKSEVNGVILNVKTVEEVGVVFRKLQSIEGFQGVLLQKMAGGVEIFAGVKEEPPFGHLLLFGLGGIFVEVLMDVQTCLVPVSRVEALHMIQGLKGRKILEGHRGKAGVDIDTCVDLLQRISTLVSLAPEIKEMDLNPLLGTGRTILAVDARIRIQK